MKNAEIEQIVIRDRFAYMDAKTFKEFLDVYPYDGTHEWAGKLLKWLIFTNFTDWRTFCYFLAQPCRLCHDENYGIDICPDGDTIDFVCGLYDRRGDEYNIGDNSATLKYSEWRERENTICWISWYGDSISEQFFMDRDNMTEDDKRQWEDIYCDQTWIVWTAEDNEKTEGEETIEPDFCEWDVQDAILEWTKKNADKLQ